MAELFIIAFVFVLLLLLLQKLEYVEKSLLLKTLKWTFVGVLILAAIYLALVGRLLQVAVIVGLLVVLLRKDVQRWLRKSR